MSKMQNPLKGTALIVWVMLFAIACTPPSEQTVVDSTPSTTSTPDAATEASSLSSLDIAIIPDQTTTKPEETVEKLDQYLEKELQLPVNIRLTESYESAIELLVTGEVAVAYLGPLAYVKAQAKNPKIEPLVAHIEKSTGRPWYTSVMVGNRAQGVKSLEDLKGKRFGFVSESSTSGFLVPSAKLKELGIEPSQDFAAVKYAGSHDKNAFALVEGKVDVIAIEKSVYVTMTESGKFSPEEYPILWESDPIPNSPLALNTEVAPNIKNRLQAALVNAPEGLVSVGGTIALGYTIVQDEDYEPIRKLQEILKLDDN